MKAKYVIALDQGTTSSRAIVFDQQSNIINVAQREFNQFYPQPGWVEHNPLEIWASQSAVLAEVIAKANIKAKDIAAIGITNQRETTILWDRETGEPVYNAIVWQCRRTSEMCDALNKNKRFKNYVYQNTGLPIDAYFSATKIKWILDNVPEAREKATRGNLLFGTVDTWLLWKLTDGAVHVTDYTNASRTMLYNIREKQWDQKILKQLDIPEAVLPDVKDSSCVYGHTQLAGEHRHRIPIAGIAGDQQAALFGQTCFRKGQLKNTYGTGCFLLMNTGNDLIQSKNGLLSTIAIGLNGKIQYALEGSIFVAGAAIQWLRDELKLITDAEDSEYFAGKVDCTNGVYVVPAFVGMGSPYWNMDARGTIVGLTRGTKREHLIRATLEAIAYQARDLIDTMKQDSGIDIKCLKVDGGAANNNFLMQFQADILQMNVQRPTVTETTALGAAYLAGLAVGFWKSQEDIKHFWQLNAEFYPQMPKEQSTKLYQGWQQAVNCALAWGKNR